MASAEIQVVNPANLLKIESFLSDPSYKEVIESSSSFNSRLCAERRMRMPFIDTQTGVAQNHCNLYMTKRQRMPGAREGQIYTYPSQRWRKARRQYLMPQTSRWGWGVLEPAAETNEDSSGLPETGGDDSRDGSQTAPAKEDSKQDWLYDEMAMEEIAELEEPEPESDEDYFDDTYANRRRRRVGGATQGRGGRKPRAPEDTPAKRGRAGRGRKRAVQGTLPYEVPGDADKPYGCELCGAKYKTRPGLTYHYTHTHKEPKEGASDNDSRDSARAAETQGSASQPPASEYQDSYVTFLNNPAHPTASGGSSARRPTPPPRPASADTSSSDSTPAAPAQPPQTPAAHHPPITLAKEPDTKASPSPYCDFCLGDDRENKKTKTPELLVSCSDCGRSGKTHRPPRPHGLSFSAHDFDSFVSQCNIASILEDGHDTDGYEEGSEVNGDAADVKKNSMDVKGNDKAGKGFMDVKETEGAEKDFMDVKVTDGAEKDSMDVKEADEVEKDSMDVKEADEAEKDLKEIKDASKAKKDFREVKKDMRKTLNGVEMQVEDDVNGGKAGELKEGRRNSRKKDEEGRKRRDETLRGVSNLTDLGVRSTRNNCRRITRGNSSAQ